MSSIKSATRYSNNNLTRSTKSDPSSSSEFSSTRAIVKKKDVGNTQINFSSIMKKFVENKKVKSYEREPKLVVAADFLAKDLKKNDSVKKGSGFSGLHKKLFKASAGVRKGEDSSKKALIEVKANTRTLAMVLRSERELLSLTKEQDEQIAELKGLIEDKNMEVEKLKDLCLKQREEIKSLKNSILFPDVTNSEIKHVVEKQGSELKQAKQLIPSLQRQVSSLTGQLQSLAADLAEVKAEKYSGSGFRDNNFSSPRTPSYDHEDALSNSLFDQDYSSGDYTTPESPDDMFLKDFNPCLTPYYATKYKEFDAYDSPDDGGHYRGNTLSPRDTDAFNTCISKLSKSSESCRSSRAEKDASHSSDQRKYTFGKPMHHKLF